MSPARPLALLLALAGCADPSCHRMVSAELLFGLSTPEGPVSEAAFRDFLTQSVTPRFPGLTSGDALGYWQGHSEPSKRVLIIASSTPTTTANLAAIRDDYKTRFHQQSVGLMLTPTCADF